MAGRPFYKLTGSGNDFIFFDISNEFESRAISDDWIRALCARGTGVGADGVVFVMGHGNVMVISYFNADGSHAALCGNASLCTVRFASLVGVRGELAIATVEGIQLAGRLVNDQPEIDLDAASRVTPDQAVTTRPVVARRIGYAIVGVPHLVVLVDDVASIDVVALGAPLRRDPLLGPEGANVNFVSPAGRMRTFERGVEGETLACGTGAVATAALLVAWGLATSPVSLTTSSGSVLRVRLSDTRASLAGEGRLVFTGMLPGGILEE
jgi:diaminopimelate epimerase